MRREPSLREELATCVYCGLSFIDDPAHWYLVSVDHIVPKYAKDRLKLDDKYIDAMANQVLCCQACNAYDNKNDLGGMPGYTPPLVWTDEEFFNLRDRAFIYRYTIITSLRKTELEDVYVLKWSKPRQDLGALPNF